MSRAKTRMVKQPTIRRKHWPFCQLYIAVSGAAGIECAHGYDVCPQCDPCTCDPALFVGVDRSGDMDIGGQG